MRRRNFQWEIRVRRSQARDRQLLYIVDTYPKKGYKNRRPFDTLPAGRWASKFRYNRGLKRYVS